MIVRIGYAPVGRFNGPCGREFAGLECDKLERRRGRTAFRANMPVAWRTELKRPGRNRDFMAVHVDSWEAGDTNFTPRFVEEFRKRRGYDPTPYLLVHGGGRIVDSPEVVRPFSVGCAADDRRFAGRQLFRASLPQLCNKRGLKFQGEIAGAMVQGDRRSTSGERPLRRADGRVSDVQLRAWRPVYALGRQGSGLRRALSTASGLSGAEAFVCFDNWTTDPLRTQRHRRPGVRHGDQPIHVPYLRTRSVAKRTGASRA